MKYQPSTDGVNFNRVNGGNKDTTLFTFTGLANGTEAHWQSAR